MIDFVIVRFYMVIKVGLIFLSVVIGIVFFWIYGNFYRKVCLEFIFGFMVVIFVLFVYVVIVNFFFYRLVGYMRVIGFGFVFVVFDFFIVLVLVVFFYLVLK